MDCFALIPFVEEGREATLCQAADMASVSEAIYSMHVIAPLKGGRIPWNLT